MRKVFTQERMRRLEQNPHAERSRTQLGGGGSGLKEMVQGRRWAFEVEVDHPASTGQRLVEAVWISKNAVHLLEGVVGDRCSRRPENAESRKAEAWTSA